MRYRSLWIVKLLILQNISHWEMSPILSPENIKPLQSVDYKGFSGERGIRTPGGVTLASFQD